MEGSYVRNVKGGGEGVPGPQGSKRQGCWEEQWSEIVARVETLEG
ncbi:hypothetical protein ACFRH9_28515 [Peribacillus butanolivorans]